MPPDLNINSLLQSAQQDGHLEELLNQLNKDFLRAGITESFDAQKKISYTARNLVATIYTLIISEFERYLNLLYIIDVDEVSIKAMPAQRVDEVAQSISLLILQRELAKINSKNRP